MYDTETTESGIYNLQSNTEDLLVLVCCRRISSELLLSQEVGWRAMITHEIWNK